jgi:hypothetical protein
MTAYNQAYSGINASSWKSSAIYLAKQKMEELRAQDYSDIDSASYPQTENVIISRGPSDSTNDDINGTRTIQVIQNSEGKEIIVTVNWTSRSGNNLRENLIYMITER